MAEKRIIRDASIRLKLQPEIKARLDVLAHLFGAPPSTLAALWLGMAIAQQERALSLVGQMVESVGGQMGAAMAEMVRSEAPETLSLFGMSSGGDAKGGATPKAGA